MLHAATSTTTTPAAARPHAVARRVRAAESAEPPGSHYAGLVTRAIAFAVDALIVNGVAVVVAAVVALVFSILPPAHLPKEASIAIGGAAFALWLVGYFTTFWTTTGQTPGNRMLGIKVVRRDGSRFRPRHAVVRLLGMVVSAPLLLGYLPILVTERRTGLHDWLAGTVVIAAGERESA